MLVYACQTDGDTFAICATLNEARFAWMDKHPGCAIDGGGCPIVVWDSGARNTEIGYISAYQLRGKMEDDIC